MDIKEFFKNDRYAAHSGIELLQADKGYARACMEIKEHHLNAGDTVQGGAIFTLADFAFAAAVNSYGKLSVSVQTSIYFHKGVGEGILYAEANPVKLGENLGNFEVRVTNEKEELIATFIATAYRKNIVLPFDPII